MKKLLFACIVLTLFSFAKNPQLQLRNFSVQSVYFQDTGTIAGHWYLMPVLTSDTAAGKIPQLNFDVKTKTFSGNTGCNNMNGRFMLNSDALSFGHNIVSTKIACPGYNEQAFLDNLIKTNRYEIKDGVLQLMYNTTVLSRWVRKINGDKTKEA